MKEYDIIAIGTGSAMNIVSVLVEGQPDIKVAVVEKDDVGGICLTRGCIPSKMLLYPAELVKKIREAKKFGIDVEIKGIDFAGIMRRTRESIRHEIKMIENGLKSSPNIDLYQTAGEFIDDYTMKVGDEVIKGEKILLCSGSKPLIPPIEGLEETGYITSDDFLMMEELPASIAIIGGGYIAMEYGFFLAMMGADVTVIEMLPRIVAGEEPEISELLQKEMEKIMKIYTGYKVKEARKEGNMKKIIATGKDGRIEVEAEEIIVAAGRASNADILKPEKTGVKTDENGWIVVDEYLQTTKPNIWACGDATGKHMFKHVANYESQIVYYNAFAHRRIKVDYHAVPHAIFTYPEVAGVGMKEEEARKKHDIMVGYYLYENTAKGEAMMAKDYFVKVILERNTYRILGAHIIGPEASILLQEIINLMYTDDGSASPIYRGMHIHPALSEVVERAFYNLEER